MSDMKSPNLTVIFITIAVVVLAGMAGGVALTIAGHDTSTFYGFFTATLATVIGFAGIIRGQSKIEEKVDTVQHNVNGRLSELIAIATSNVMTENDVERVREIERDAGQEVRDAHT